MGCPSPATRIASSPRSAPAAACIPPSPPVAIRASPWESPSRRSRAASPGCACASPSRRSPTGWATRSRAASRSRAAPRSTGDRHAIVIDRDRCRLYEFFRLFPPRPGSRTWRAGSGAVWNLRSNRLRPRGWTSADAAGLPILPGLARYDEVRRGRIDHALRVTVHATRPAFVYPARHYSLASPRPRPAPHGAAPAPEGERGHLPIPRQSRIVLTALKRYGMLVADNGGDWFVTGAPSRGWATRTCISSLRIARARLRGRRHRVAPPAFTLTIGQWGLA